MLLAALIERCSVSRMQDFWRKPGYTGSFINLEKHFFDWHIFFVFTNYLPIQPISIILTVLVTFNFFVC